MIIFFVVLAVIIIIVSINVLSAPKIDKTAHYEPEPATTSQLEKLAAAVRIPTVSHYDDSLNDLENYRKFQDFLVAAFPLFHRTAERIVLSDYAVIYKWKGQNDEFSAEFPPVLLAAHYDVVPADESKWSHRPFAAEISDGYLWGRGTLDTKNTLMASLEAAERLCEEGFVPQRTVFFAFGGDEEISGERGACRSADWFAGQSITFDWLWDEGAITADGIMPGIDRKLSLLGTAEKGQVNILLTAKSAGGGHAAMPPGLTATGRIARAVARIEARPFPLRWLKTTRTFFSRMACAGGPAYRIVLSNLWLTGGLIKFLMSKTPSTAAMFRTTCAPTMISGSSKENVLADEAIAVVNVRILPGDTVEKVIARLRKVIADDKVAVAVKNDNDADEPVFESSIKSEGYGILEESILEVIPDSVVLPYLATTASDSRHYADCCRNIYRYAPMILNQAELDRIHSVDERISPENYGLGIKCYKTVMRKL